MPHDDDSIRDKLSDEGLYNLGIVPTDGGDTLYRYDVEAQQDLRRAFQILDGVDDIKPAMIAELESNPSAFDKPAKKHGFTGGTMSTRANSYIDAIVDEAKGNANAKADLIYSHVARIMSKHRESYHGE